MDAFDSLPFDVDVTDVCTWLFSQGSGKSALARWFAARLGYPVKLFALYADMDAKSLFQRRNIDRHGLCNAYRVTVSTTAVIAVCDSLHI
jgi:hypothetical protein